MNERRGRRVDSAAIGGISDGGAGISFGAGIILSTFRSTARTVGSTGAGADGRGAGYSASRRGGAASRACSSSTSR
ncbi:MAG TPA: hypothetical protein VIM99_16155, partial [Blastocatellia bacterium]